MKSDRDLPENVHDFVDEISNTKSYIQRCIKVLVKETNKHKLDYGQLRYIFRRVREECGVSSFSSLALSIFAISLKV